MNDLPQSRNKLNDLIKDIYTLNSWISATVEYHSYYPFRFLEIKRSLDNNTDHLIQKQIDILDFKKMLPDINREYLLLGECFVHHNWNQKDLIWDEYTIQNPSYVIIQHSIKDGQIEFYLRPDERLRSLVLKKEPSAEDLETIAFLDSATIDCIRNGKNIPMNNFSFSSFIRKTNPYDARGTSYLLPYVKNILYLQKIKELIYESKMKSIDTSEWEKEAEVLQTSIDDSISSASFGLYGTSGLYVESCIARTTQHMTMFANWLRKKIFAPLFKNNSINYQININFNSRAFEKFLLDPTYRHIVDKEKYFDFMETNDGR